MAIHSFHYEAHEGHTKSTKFFCGEIKTELKTIEIDRERKVYHFSVYLCDLCSKFLFNHGGHRVHGGKASHQPVIPRAGGVSKHCMDYPNKSGNDENNKKITL